jgi:hypothetical protein
LDPYRARPPSKPTPPRGVDWRRARRWVAWFAFFTSWLTLLAWLALRSVHYDPCAPVRISPSGILALACGIGVLLLMADRAWRSFRR